MKTKINISELVAAYTAEAKERIAVKQAADTAADQIKTDQRNRVREALMHLEQDLADVYEPLIAAGIRVRFQSVPSGFVSEAYSYWEIEGHQGFHVSAYEDTSRTIHYSSCCGIMLPLRHESTIQPAEIVVKHAAYAGQRLALHFAGKHVNYL